MSRAAAKKKPADEVVVPMVADDRAALAAAIEAKRKADAAVVRQEQAIERAAALVGEAEAAVEAARRKVPDAEAADVQRTASLIKNEAKIISPWSTDKAHSAVRVAEEHCALTRKALDRLRSELLVLEDDAAEAASDVLVEVKLLALPFAEKSFNELSDLKRRVAISQKVLAELVAGGDERDAPRFNDAFRSMRAGEKRDHITRSLRERSASLLLLGAPDAAHAAAATALAEWRAALRALQTDAAARLPSVP